MFLSLQAHYTEVSCTTARQWCNGNNGAVLENFHYNNEVIVTQTTLQVIVRIQERKSTKMGKKRDMKTAKANAHSSRVKPQLYTK